MPAFTSRELPEEYDVLAPDGSEIRVLAVTERASVAHGRLPAGGVSQAISHRTVEEVWVVLSGEGELWRRLGDQEETIALHAGVSLTIPVGTHFQFRTTGDVPLTFIMCTVPPWPGNDEAVLVPGCWELTTGC